MAAKTLRQQWADYGARPPAARWASRSSLVIGVLIGFGLTLLALAAIAKLATLVWGWL